MTPFMLTIHEHLDGAQHAPPETEPADAVSVAGGADTRVIIGFLAEQLISEANATLRGYGDADLPSIGLVDETGPGTGIHAVLPRPLSARADGDLRS